MPSRTSFAPGKSQSARGVVRRAVRERRVGGSQSVSPGHRAEPPPPAESAAPANPVERASFKLLPFGRVNKLF